MKLFLMCFIFIFHNYTSSALGESILFLDFGWFGGVVLLILPFILQILKAPQTSYDRHRK